MTCHISIHILHSFLVAILVQGFREGLFLGQIPSPLWILVNFFMAQLSLRRVVALAVVALGWGHTGPWWEQELLENRLEKNERLKSHPKKREFRRIMIFDIFQVPS